MGRKGQTILGHFGKLKKIYRSVMKSDHSKWLKTFSLHTSGTKRGNYALWTNPRNE